MLCVVACIHCNCSPQRCHCSVWALTTNKTLAAWVIMASGTLCCLSNQLQILFSEYINSTGTPWWWIWSFIQTQLYLHWTVTVIISLFCLKWIHTARVSLSPLHCRSLLRWIVPALGTVTSRLKYSTSHHSRNNFYRSTTIHIPFNPSIHDTVLSLADLMYRHVEIWFQVHVCSDLSQRDKIIPMLWHFWKCVSCICKIQSEWS